MPTSTSPRGWTTETLNSIADWSSGGTPSKARPEYWNGSLPWVSPKDMKVFNLSDTQEHISERAIAAGARIAPSGTTFIVVRGMILAHTFPVCVAQRPMSFNQDVKAIVPHKAADGRFLAHWLNGRSDALLRLVTEATHGTKRIELADLLKHPIELPPLNEQRRAAEVLDTLDEAIFKTERIVAKLKHMKQGLLHDLLTRGIDENGEVRVPERCPQEFKDSPIGRLPNSWEVLPVGSAGHVQLGRQRSPATEKGLHLVPYLRVANVFDGHIDYSDVLCMNFSPHEQETYSIRPGDILLNEGQSLELVGRSALYDGEPGKYCFQNTLIRFRAVSSTRCYYARFVFKYWLDTGRFIPVAKQTTSIAHLGALRFARMAFPRPPLAEQIRIEETLLAADHRIRAETDRLEKQKLLKQGLMEDLLTGRVRVTPLLTEPPP